MEAHSLFELNEYIRRVVALNFREPVWIKAEANQVNQSRNNFYLDLVEKKEGKDDIIAQANGVLWARNYFFLKKKLGDIIDDILVDGSEILIKVKVDFNERYGLKLQIEDIDAAYTLGQAEIRRQEIIDKLKSKGLDELNCQYPLPQVMQRIAVLSSPTAAGYKDFVNQLEQNSYGYLYDIDLYPMAVQGTQLEAQLIKAIDDVGSNKKAYDCIVVVRGGGSKLDLSWFDTYPIAEKLATAPYPVITGIGHEIDFSIADMVAHTHLKTPTAAADFLIEHNMFFESSVIEMTQQISTLSQQMINNNVIALDSIIQNISSYSSQKISNAEIILDVMHQNTMSHAINLIAKKKSDLLSKEILIESLSPSNVLNRGYAVLYQGDASVHSQKKIKKGDKFEIELVDGRFTSERIN